MEWQAKRLKAGQSGPIAKSNWRSDAARPLACDPELCGPKQVRSRPSQISSTAIKATAKGAAATRYGRQE